MKTLKLKSFFAIVVVLFSLSSISCGKETPEDLKETRIDARSGILEVDTYYKNGVKERQIIQGNAEVRFYTIEVDSVKATSLQENTTGRVNGWIVDKLRQMDGFVYYPETDSLRKEFHYLKEVK